MSESVIKISNRSGFVDADVVFDFGPANGTLLQIFAALDAGGIMLARHINAVFLLFAADHAGVVVQLLAHQRHFYLADVSLVRPNLEHRFVLNLE